jgi:uncharacterized membrane protein YqhA
MSGEPAPHPSNALDSPPPARRSIEPADQDEPPGQVEALVGRILSTSRYFILLAILGSFVAACGVLIYAWVAGFAQWASDYIHPELDPGGIKKVSVEVISLVDLFLLSTVLFVVAIGLYQLFVDPRPRRPRWLRIADLDDLKERLLSTVVVLLAVSFLGYVVTWDGAINLVGVGAGIGIVMFAIAQLLQRLHHSSRE